MQKREFLQREGYEGRLGERGRLLDQRTSLHESGFAAN